MSSPSSDDWRAKRGDDGDFWSEHSICLRVTAFCRSFFLLLQIMMMLFAFTVPVKSFTRSFTAVSSHPSVAVKAVGETHGRTVECFWRHYSVWIWLAWSSTLKAHTFTFSPAVKAFQLHTRRREETSAAAFHDPNLKYHLSLIPLLSFTSEDTECDFRASVTTWVTKYVTA